MIFSRFFTHKALLGAVLLCSANSAFANNITATQQQFFQNLTALCGKAFVGTVVKGNASDDKMRSQPLLMHVRECSDTEIKVPFHVGEDRSRTWVISKTDTGLRLKHDHRHKDGSADKVTMYGGDTTTTGTAELQLFPADQYSKNMFIANKMAVSNGNTWLLEIQPGKIYRYGLKREGREFMVEFDLTKAVTAPPAPWGHK
ncbi:hypothetical protein [Rheinheimera sp.]|uniref:hypothetical protein n=1 Tax=Rheinheimera sp. TaxID=1869214 RepID=UPI0027B87DBF|nr:hypothetical protein [Rheinheimera sp.]